MVGTVANRRQLVQWGRGGTIKAVSIALGPRSPDSSIFQKHKVFKVPYLTFGRKWEKEDICITYLTPRIPLLTFFQENHPRLGFKGRNMLTAFVLTGKKQEQCSRLFPFSPKLR
jgi:hypothetical protein